MGEWRPYLNAPRDGTRFLARWHETDDRKMAHGVVYWQEYSGRWEEAAAEVVPFDDWMPLPD